MENYSFSAPVGNDIIKVLTTGSQCRDYDITMLPDPIKDGILTNKLQFECGSQSEKPYLFCIPFSKPQVL